MARTFVEGLLQCPIRTSFSLMRVVRGEIGAQSIMARNWNNVFTLLGPAGFGLFFGSTAPPVDFAKRRHPQDYH
jgi:hypothetical protein